MDLIYNNNVNESFSKIAHKINTQVMESVSYFNLSRGIEIIQLDDDISISVANNDNYKQDKQ